MISVASNDEHLRSVQTITFRQPYRDKACVYCNPKDIQVNVGESNRLPSMHVWIIGRRKKHSRLETHRNWSVWSGVEQATYAACGGHHELLDVIRRCRTSRDETTIEVLRS